MKWLSKDFLRKLCDNIWGKELTYLQVDEIIKKLNP